MASKFIPIIISLTFLPALSGIGLAQEFNLTPRDNTIFVTLNQLQQREEAIRDAMRDAQLRLVESDYAVTKSSAGKISDRKLFREKIFSIKGHPYVDITNTFNDNIDNTRHKKSAIINTVSPGFKLNLIGRKKSVYLDTYLSALYYNNRSRENIWEAGTSVLGNISFGKFLASVYDNYNDNRIGGSDVGVKLNTADYYWSNKFNTSFSGNFNRYGFDLGYTRNDIEYNEGYDPDSLTDDDEDSVNASHFEEIFNFNQYLRLATKTRLIFEYSYGNVTYTTKLTPSEDNFYNIMGIGVSGVLSPKTTFLTKLNYTDTDFKEKDDTSDLLFGVNIGYRLSDRADLAFSPSYLVHSTASTSQRYNKVTMDISGNHRFAFNPRLKASLGYKQEFFDYGKRDGTETVNTYSFGLAYAFKRWLDFSLGYVYKERNSNVNEEYYGNTFTFKTQAKF
ncbi:MAG: hypothetical protein C4533_06345 [Candidatus Omnitrophota bacterium]|jgi:hypothetical protein|nr:MAG: hypothetical protein C4533_06345 [Candidatus Omnitrophota bacterium]